MNSWNRSTSYARRVKISNLGLTREQESHAYDLIYVEDTFLEINERIREFSEENGYRYQACFNGRSSGYILLIQGGREPSGYQSFCTECGQLNYKKVLPLADSRGEKSGTTSGLRTGGLRMYTSSRKRSPNMVSLQKEFCR